MKFIQFFPDGLRETQKPQFYGAAAYGGLTLTGIALLVMVALRLGGNFEEVILAMNAVALTTMIFVLIRIHRAFKQNEASVVAGDKAAINALLGITYGFRWGNAMYFLGAVAVLYLYHTHHS